jgi:prefoldin beta subunit
MTDKKNIEASIIQLKELEQNLQTSGMQKQNMQIQLAEIENSVKELEQSKEKAYKVIGPIMIEQPTADVLKDLQEKKELLTFRIEGAEKKEKKLKEDFTTLQKEVMEKLK